MYVQVLRSEEVSTDRHIVTVHAAAGEAEAGLPESLTRESVEVRAIVFTKKS